MLVVETSRWSGFCRLCCVESERDRHSRLHCRTEQSEETGQDGLERGHNPTPHRMSGMHFIMFESSGFLAYNGMQE